MMKYKKSLLGMLSAISLVGLSACQTDGGSRLQVEPDNTKIAPPSTPQTKRYVKGNLLVGFDPKADYSQAIAALEKQYDGVKLKRMLMENDSAVIALFTVPNGQEKTLITAFQQHAAVKYAEVDGIMTTQ